MMTDDITRFCDSLAHLYSQISKPILDIVLMSAQLLWLVKEQCARVVGSLWSRLQLSRRPLRIIDADGTHGVAGGC